MMKRFLTLLALVTLSPAFFVQQMAPANLPPLPAQASVAERNVFARCSLNLSSGRYQEAEALLRSWALRRRAPVFAELSAMAPETRDAARRCIATAVHDWNRALEEEQFVMADQSAGAAVSIRFADKLDVMSDGRKMRWPSDSALRLAGSPSSRRTVACVISLHDPFTGQLYEEVALGHLAAQALGVYLGLGPSNLAADVMGPPTKQSVAAPSNADVAGAFAMQKYRAALLDLARRRVSARIPSPTILFDKQAFDAGEILRGGKLQGTFNVTNAGGTPLEIDAKALYGAKIAKIDRTIQPGRVGKIVAEYDTSQAPGGALTKEIEVTTNDPGRPRAHLQLQGLVTIALEIVPSQTLLMPLLEDAPTVQGFGLRQVIKQPVEITGVSCSVPYATAQLSPVANPSGGGRAWSVMVTVAPEAPAGSSEFTITARTSLARLPKLTVLAQCWKGILATPPVIYLGRVTAAAPAPVTATATLDHKGKAFKVTSVTSDDPNLEVASEPITQGGQYRLTITYKGGWPTGAVQKKVIVQTDDPRQSRIEIPVTANVTAVTASPRVSGSK